MSFKSLIRDKPFIIILIFSTFSLVFQYKVNGLIFLIIGFFVWGYSFLTYSNSSVEFSLIKLLILSIPLSFVSILNESYGDLPVSWYNLFFTTLVVWYGLKIVIFKRVRFSILSLISLYILIMALVPLIKSEYFLDGLKQYINISTSFILLIISGTFSKTLSIEEKKELPVIYIKSSTIAVIGLYIQFISINLFNNIIGYYLILGGSRETYSSLFTDFSFLSLYLASGAMLVYSLRNRVTTSDFQQLFFVSFLLIGSILTSARTGIAAFLLVFVLSSIPKFIKLLISGSIKVVAIVIANISLVLISFTIISRFRPQDLLSDSGRGYTSNMALRIFMSNPLLGVGFGIGNYRVIYGTMPHNILLQLLVQGGIVLAIPVVIFLVYVVFSMIHYKKDTLLTFLVLLVGALFIPDIFNSRFFAIVLFIIGLDFMKNEQKIL